MSTTCPACFIVEIGMLRRRFCSSVITLNKERPVGLLKLIVRKGGYFLISLLLMFTYPRPSPALFSSNICLVNGSSPSPKEKGSNFK